MATLYIVATPIGNLEDITIRAINILRSVDCIACEDTRHSRILLAKYDIRKPLISCHSFNEEQSAQSIITHLGKGRDIAYISDAGTPCISDPGSKVLRMVRSKGFTISPIPGPSALSTILSVNSIYAPNPMFVGFLSSKNGRRKKQLKDLLHQDHSFILFESPFRVLKLLQTFVELEEEYPQVSGRTLLCGRELTKKNEELLVASANVLYTTFSSYPSIKGEFVFLVSGREKRLNFS